MVTMATGRDILKSAAKCRVEDGYMKSLIYYPSFEFTDELWLKFALLYIGQVSPIIPDSGYSHLSNLFHRLGSDTDLIKIYRPRPSEGKVASLKAIMAIDDLLHNRNHLYGVFERSNTSDWENIELQDHTLFHEKFNSNFYRYCINNKLAHGCSEGIKVHADISDIYMTILADYIAEFNGTSIITDKVIPETIGIITRTHGNISQNQTTFARSLIQLYLPANLAEISIDKLIDFRNREDFRRRLDAFHKQLDNLYDNLSPENDCKQFIDNLQTSIKDLWSPISKLGQSMFTFGMGVLTCVNTSNPDWLKTLGPIFTLGLISGQLIDLNNYRQGFQSKRLGQRYLTDLSRLR